MSNRKLLVVIGSLMVGGTETFLVRYLSYLVSRGWNIELFTLAYHPGDLAEVLMKNGVTITPILTDEDRISLSRLPKAMERIVRIFLCVFRLRRHLQKEKNALLHLFLPEAYVLGMMAALLSQFPGPKIMSRRSLNFYQKKRPFVAWLEKKIHRYTNKVIGNSVRVMEQLYEEGLPKEKLKLIYNGIERDQIQKPEELKIEDQNADLYTLRQTIRNDLDIPDHTLVFIIVANLIPYKGHQDLLQALHLIKDKISIPWKLICVGRDQGILENLKLFSQQCELQHNILWLGERKDVAKLLRCADVGILCSHEEGFSNAILEGMAAGLPMVVTDVGGNGEAVIHNETGYVVAPKNPVALSEALFKLIEDEPLMKRFGSEGRKRVVEHFTLEKCVNHHIAIYQECFSALETPV